MTVKIDCKRYRLHKHTGIQPLLIKEEEKQNVVNIPHPEVGNLGPGRKVYTCKARSDRKDFKKADPLTAYRKNYVFYAE